MRPGRWPCATSPASASTTDLLASIAQRGQRFGNHRELSCGGLETGGFLWLQHLRDVELGCLQICSETLQLCTNGLVDVCGLFVLLVVVVLPLLWDGDVRSVCAPRSGTPGRQEATRRSTSWPRGRR